MKQYTVLKFKTTYSIIFLACKTILYCMWNPVTLFCLHFTLLVFRFDLWTLFFLPMFLFLLSKSWQRKHEFQLHGNFASSSTKEDLMICHWKPISLLLRLKKNSQINVLIFMPTITNFTISMSFVCISSNFVPFSFQQKCLSV